MITEINIARENLRKRSFHREDKDKSFYFNICLSCENHKLTCQRFLKFLGKLNIDTDGMHPDEINICNEKLNDLTQAIKEYEGAGI